MHWFSNNSYLLFVSSPLGFYNNVPLVNVFALTAWNVVSVQNLGVVRFIPIPDRENTQVSETGRVLLENTCFRQNSPGRVRGMISLYSRTSFVWASQEALVVKNPPTNAGDIRDVSLIPGSGRSPGGGHGNPLQCSCLENPMDGGAWRAAVHGVTKSRTLFTLFQKVLLSYN